MRTIAEAHQQQLGTLYWTERVVSNPIKWVILISSASLLYSWDWRGISATGQVTLLIYALQNLLFTLLFARAAFSAPLAKLLAFVSYACDFLFVGYLIFGLGGMASQVAFLMYIIVIFKSSLYYPVFKESLLVLPLAIALYLVLIGLQQGPDVFSAYDMRQRLFLLLGIPAVTIYTARLLERRQRDLFDLSTRLETKTVQLNLQTSELQTVIEGMHDGLLVTDSLLNVVTLNSVARAILRLSPSDQAPLPLEISRNGLALWEVVSDALNSPETTSKREVLLPLPNTGDAEPRCYQAVASYIPGENGGGAQVVVILRDITEQKQLEDAKSNFLSVVSHELRTPLSSIKGFLNIILSGRAGPLNETQTDFLSTVSGQAEYLHAMINDLVEFSRIQVGRTALMVGPVSLVEISRSIPARLMPLAHDKAIRVLNLVPEDLSLVEGDQLQLSQVVSNLLVNAIKFTPAGGTITLSAKEDERQVVFSVADTGEGIPLEEQEKIFEPFYQVSRGSSRLHGGMGLGLAICRRILDRHGGRLFMQSEEGTGSVFHFTVPKHLTARNRADRELVLPS
ncbi:MAG: GHKL domain-containing protein [Chloroflexota bacterium]|nr:MAG: GHKL domain-containing protein [Chloroflexota bacterium]